MVGSGPNKAESMGSQRQDHFINLEQGRDWEGSVHTTHTSRIQSRSGGHVSHEEHARNMQQKIDHLRRKLHRTQKRRIPSSSKSPSNDDDCYRSNSRTPPSEFFSCDDDHHRRRRDKSPSCKGLGNDAVSRALNQISKSPFTRRIEGGKLPRCFIQPTFTMYSGHPDPVEHVSHFNQRMAVHSKNEA
ncbi:hypothetical protein SO802_028512 [Lithocarpus litseifolius]|uniref:Uncharacterized protein n=1 Tax=Lithocarpus litseifolius TaxID=425828 RepID=A0AAW2BRZ4_9ROSI